MIKRSLRTALGMALLASGCVAPELETGDERRAVSMPGMVWNPAHSGNYTSSSRGAGDITHIVIHTTQGSYSGAINWFKNPSSNVSAHYVIRSSDGEITQMVDDSDIAWHDGCFNTATIGVEHEGFVESPDTWYTDAMYAQSAQLVAALVTEYDIPLDREHILGHGETPDCSSHTDPGAGWDWDYYMDLVEMHVDGSLGAEYLGASQPDVLLSGEEAVITLDLENTGTTTWSIENTQLGTQMPADRTSDFFVDGNWISPSRATAADHSSYGPGDTGSFTFLVRAPDVAEPTAYSEYFQLVEDETWFGPMISLDLTVMPVGSAETEPKPDSVHELDRADADGDAAIMGGCSTGSGSRSGLGLLLIALALAARRSRRT